MVQYSVYWVDLNPTQGAEMQKVRPCVVLSPTEANRHFRTVLAAPVTGTDLAPACLCLRIVGFLTLDIV